jgi:divalent metal cation (Fe/Co/Zn/Cd) transporter
MNHKNYKYVALFVAAYIILTMALLWSWNQLAELFNWPYLQLKQASAVMILVLLMKFVIGANGFYYKNKRRRHCESD